MNEDELCIPLQVSNGSFEQNVSVNVDISDKSTVERINYLYDCGEISNEEKIELYCDGIINKSLKGVSCLHGVLFEIKCYSDENSNIPERLKKKIDLIFERPENCGNGSRYIPYYNYTYTSNHFTVYYPATITDTNAIAFASYLESLYSTFSNYGFLPPVLETSCSYINVYLTPDYNPLTSAEWIMTEIDGNKCSGYFVVSNFSTIADLDQEKLGHEYFHAIQGAYNSSGDWFSEAAANWATIKATSHKYQAEINYLMYMNNPSVNIISEPEEGAGRYYLLFGIEKSYGGVEAIVEVYNQLSNLSSHYSNNDLFDAIKDALHIEGYTSASFETLYQNCVIKNSYPGILYSPEYYCTVNNPFPYGMGASGSSYSSGTKAINQHGCLYFRFVPFSNTLSTLSVTVDVSNSNALCRYIKKTSSNTVNSVGLTLSSSRFTVVQTNFGNASTKEAVVVPYCLNTANSFTVSVTATKTSVYKITNVGANKCLNIYGDNLTSLYNNQNVCLWSDSGSNEQKWAIDSIGTGTYIKSIINTAYGLNVYRVGSPWNCDVYPISGNETDAQVDFISVTGGYKIKLHNYNLYLTVASSSNGANVYWAASSSSTYQVWSLTPLA